MDLLYALDDRFQDGTIEAGVDRAGRQAARRRHDPGRQRQRVRALPHHASGGGVEPVSGRRARPGSARRRASAAAPERPGRAGDRRGVRRRTRIGEPVPPVALVDVTGAPPRRARRRRGRFASSTERRRAGRRRRGRAGRRRELLATRRRSTTPPQAAARAADRADPCRHRHQPRPGPHWRSSQDTTGSPRGRPRALATTIRPTTGSPVFPRGRPTPRPWPIHRGAGRGHGHHYGDAERLPPRGPGRYGRSTATSLDGLGVGDRAERAVGERSWARLRRPARCTS